MKYLSIFALVLYAFSVTGWIQYNTQQHTLEVAKFEREASKLRIRILELETAEPVELEPVECVTKKKETYDSWVTSKPCPPGKDGPLCHMDETDYD